MWQLLLCFLWLQVIVALCQTYFRHICTWKTICALNWFRNNFTAWRIWSWICVADQPENVLITKSFLLLCCIFKLAASQMWQNGTLWGNICSLWCTDCFIIDRHGFPGVLFSVVHMLCVWNSAWVWRVEEYATPKPTPKRCFCTSLKICKYL